MGIILLEGIGKQLDPEVNIFNSSKPVIAAAIWNHLRGKVPYESEEI